MAMVLGLHTNRYGGFLSIDNPKWYVYIINYYEHLCIVAVNVFVIISSWFLRESSNNSTKKVVSLLTTILFWTVMSLLFVRLIGEEVSFKWIVKSIPFFGRAYDFLSGYIVMYMLSPALNNMLNSSSKRQRLLLCVGSFTIFSLMSPITSSHYLLINSGYSCTWFICLYIMTSYVKELEIKFLQNKFIFMYLTISLVGAIASVNGIPIISSLAYNNFIVTIGAFSIFLYFRDLHVSGKYLIKCISFLSPMTLGVFLIHDHNLMEQLYLKINIYRCLSGWEFVYIILFPLFVIMIYLFCSILEYARIKIFNILAIPSLINQLSISVDKRIDKISSY